jgi:hypothetical protein
MCDVTNVPIENGTPVRPVANSQMEMSRMPDREEAMDTVKAWKNAVDLIERVMNTVRPTMEVCIFFLYPLLG